MLQKRSPAAKAGKRIKNYALLLYLTQHRRDVDIYCIGVDSESQNMFIILKGDSSPKWSNSGKSESWKPKSGQPQGSFDAFYAPRVEPQQLTNSEAESLKDRRTALSLTLPAKDPKLAMTWYM